MKILQISLGNIGQRHLRNCRHLLPKAEIAIYRQHTKGVKEVPEGADHFFQTLEQASDYKPDLVLISSPASEHISNALHFLKQGAHLFIEKPLACTSDGLQNLQDVAREKGTFVMVGYVLRFLPILHEIRRIIAEDKLGKIHTAYVETGQYLPDWRPTSDYRQGVSAQQKLGGGVLLELSHELDYASWLFGSPNSLFCSASKLSDLEINVEDSAQVIFEYDEGTQRRVSVSIDFLQRTASMLLHINGSKGTLRADLIAENLHFFAPGDREGQYEDHSCKTGGNEVYLRQFDYLFHKTIPEYVPQFAESENFDQHVDLQHASKVISIVEACKKSSASGQRIHLV